MTEAYTNRLATAVPPFEVHQAFQEFAYSLFPDNRRVALFKRMASLSGIEQRYSVLADGEDPEGNAVNAHDFYVRGKFPDTAARMRLFERFSPALAVATELSPRQRDVFVALALNEVPIDVLAERLDTNRNALYKTLHDARRKLRRAVGELEVR